MGISLQAAKNADGRGVNAAGLLFCRGGCNDLHRLEGLDRVREIIEGAAPVVAEVADERPVSEVEAPTDDEQSTGEAAQAVAGWI